MTTATTIAKPASNTSKAVTASLEWEPIPYKTSDVLIDIVIPMYNEAHVVEATVRTLGSYLAATMPYRWQITLVDNASTDTTWHVAKSLTHLPHVSALQVDLKGRGRALKYAWLRSKADILTYMDVDLSTDLAYLLPLIQPLVEGQAVIATGSRLRSDSQVIRSPKREFISRSYNFLLRRILKLKTSDAQCGFKAIRADIAKRLLPEVTDTDWFFDTELLAKAEHHGLTVHELGVAWQEDKDSRVKLARTVVDDLKGVHRLRQEFSSRARWERLTLAGILGASLLLLLIGALHNGYANSFYAAAVQAGTKSWKAFFFGSLDASNYITVDKPPFALWPMELSSRLFGFHAWSMLLPNVLAGVGTVYLVYSIVRRWFSAQSALIAAAVMALSPVAVMMFGFNNPDAILTLLLTMSMYTFIRAIEANQPLRWLTLTAILTGCAFNTKMLQGLIVLPAFALIYLFLAPPKFLVRLRHLLIVSIPLAIATLWWPTIVSLIPASSRPYIGSSTDNNIWNLIFGYNGVGRLLGSSSGQGGGGMKGGMSGTAATQATGAAGQTMPSFGAGTSAGSTFGGGTPAGGMMAGGGGGHSGPGGTGFGGSTGVLRMFNGDFGPNIGWYLIVSLLGVGLALWVTRRAPRSDRTRIAFLAWGGWLLLHIIVFSMVSGVIHPYYPVVMTPAVAALVGMSLPLMLQAYRRQTAAAFILPISIAATGITACILLGYQATWLPWLRWVVLVLALGSAIGLIVQLVLPAKRLLQAALISGAIACGVSPLAYSVVTASVAHTGSIPTAGPEATAMAGSNNESSTAEASFLQYLLQHRGSAKWIVAVASANESAPIQIASGQPVMAIGGFNGSDAAMTVAKLQALIAAGQLRYYAVASGGQTGGTPGSGNSTILTWIEAHATKVNYGGTSYTLYDLDN